MTGYNEWLPFALFAMAAVFSLIGTLVASVHKLWSAATFFSTVLAVSVASIIIYSV